MSLTPIVCCACLATDHIELSTVIMFVPRFAGEFVRFGGYITPIYGRG